MKGNHGITLIVLIITIVVLLIIMGVTINYGLSTGDSVDDNIKQVNLAMVQQGIAQQYTLLISEGSSGQIATNISEDETATMDADRPSLLVGTRVADATELENYGFNEYCIFYSKNEDNIAYEEYYYILDDDDLDELGVTKETASNTMEYKYIVNYSTGEVFDIVNETYNTSDEGIYLKGTTSTSERSYEFSD